MTKSCALAAATAALTALFALGCSGEFMEGMNAGMAEAQVQQFDEAIVAVEALPESAERDEVLAMLAEGRTAAEAGQLGMLEGTEFAVLAVELSGDGAVSEDDVRQLTDTKPW